ncbi:hypothetical protein AYI69_g10781, partial [Smittium culicis]
MPSGYGAARAAEGGR